MVAGEDIYWVDLGISDSAFAIARFRAMNFSRTSIVKPSRTASVGWMLKLGHAVSRPTRLVVSWALLRKAITARTVMMNPRPTATRVEASALHSDGFAETTHEQPMA